MGNELGAHHSEANIITDVTVNGQAHEQIGKFMENSYYEKTVAISFFLHENKLIFYFILSHKLFESPFYIMIYLQGK